MSEVPDNRLTLVFPPLPYFALAQWYDTQGQTGPAADFYKRVLAIADADPSIVAAATARLQQLQTKAD